MKWEWMFPKDGLENVNSLTPIKSSIKWKEEKKTLYQLLVVKSNMYFQMEQKMNF